jgi:hypothetical protein
MTHIDDSNGGKKIGKMIILGISLMMLMHSADVLFAQTSNNKIGYGLGFGLWQVAEDQDYTSEGSPLNLFFDWDITENWLKIRIGYNRTSAILEFDYYNKSWESDLTTQNVYVAYRYKYDLTDDIQLFGMGGLSTSFSNLRMNNGAESHSDTGMGTVLGGGIFYFMADFGYGAQLDIYSGKGNFNGATISTGSTQLLLTAVQTF